MSRTSLALLLLLAPGSLSALGLKSFPFINRGGPKLKTLTFIQSPTLSLANVRVGVFGFSIPSYADPPPPPFGELLYQALLAEQAAGRVTYLDAAWDSEKLAEQERIASAASYGRARGLDLIVLGRLDSMLSRSSGGLVLKVTCRLVSTQTGEVLWYGSKKADWLRRYPLEDCFRTLAYSFLEEWIE